ncbi:MAG: ATP-binding protein, partial [Candidatus Bipolaricaulia bacterium]
MSEAVREAVLAQYTKTLKMPAVAREYAALARQAREEGWDYEDFLRDLLEAEIQSRQKRTSERRLKEARFPDLKTLEQIDWQALKGISRPKMLELASCEYLERADDIVLAGP